MSDEKFDVYVIVVESTEAAFDKLAELSAIDLPVEVARNVDEDAARALADDAING